MDEQTTFETFLTQRVQSLRDRLNDVKHEFSNEHVRRLRVGIKRWRTLDRLITTLHPQPGKSGRLDRSVKRLFKRAGRVRDNQLNRQLLVGLGLAPELEKHLERFFKRQEKRARKRLKKAIKSFHSGRLQKLEQIVGQPGWAIESLAITHQLSRLMGQEAHAITALPPADASPEQLHTIRKHLKALIEMGEVIISITPDKSLTHLLQRAKTVQRRLGNWHDYISLIEHLNHYIAGHPSVLPPKSVHALHQRFDRIIQQRTERVRHQVANLSQWLPLLTS